MSGRALGLLGCLIALSAACSQSLPGPAAPLTPPLRWCAGLERVACRATAEIETWLRSPELSIVGAAATTGGIQGARVLTLSAPGSAGPVVFRAKWRAHSTLAPLNDPRREIAAYRLQQLFLQPNEYVVPPAQGRCLDLDQYRARVEPDAQPTFSGIDCVFGVLSYWLEDAETPSELYDPELYRENAAYRRSISSLNLLTFLIHHGDSHARQFLKVEHTDGPRVYAVDNSLSFGTFVNTDIGDALDLSRIRVPALPRDAVLAVALESPRELWTRAVLECHAESGGRLVPIEPELGVVPRHAGMYWVGRRLVLALTKFELGLVERKLAELSTLIDRREVALF